jgi:hypothetical protein
MRVERPTWNWICVGPNSMSCCANRSVPNFDPRSFTKKASLTLLVIREMY